MLPILRGRRACPARGSCLRIDGSPSETAAVSLSGVYKKGLKETPACRPTVELHPRPAATTISRGGNAWAAQKEGVRYRPGTPHPTCKVGDRHGTRRHRHCAPSTILAAKPRCFDHVGGVVLSPMWGRGAAHARQWVCTSGAIKSIPGGFSFPPTRIALPATILWSNTSNTQKAQSPKCRPDLGGPRKSSGSNSSSNQRGAVACAASCSTNTGVPFPRRMELGHRAPTRTID